VNPSAGGQAALAPRNEHEIRLLRFFRRKYPYHVSIDRALSWRGLLRIYHYLLEMKSGTPAKEVRRAIEQDPDGAPALISRNGVYKTCPVCTEAVALYVGLFGAMAGNMALSVMATGGVYIAGRTASKILPRLTDGAFINAFGAKGSSAELLKSIPVHVIVDPEVALLGVARHAAREVGT
jgi:glucokinase